MATQSQHILSCSVAVENNTYSATDSGGFGNINPLTSRPTPLGIGSSPALDFKSIEMRREGLVMWGDPVVDMRENETRGDSGLPIPEPNSMTDCSTGDLIQHREGEISLELELRGLGDKTAYTNNAALPWVQILRSGMAYAANSVAGPATLSAVEASTATVLKVDEGAAGGEFIVGQMISTVLNGKFEVSWITGVVEGSEAEDTVTISPGFSAAPALGAAVRLCDNLFSDPALSYGDSVALKLISRDAVTYAYGCRMQSCSIKMSEGQAVAEVTLLSAHIEDDRTGTPTPVNPDLSDGALPHLRGSRPVYTAEHSGSTAPYALASNLLPLKVETLALNIQNTLASDGYSDTLLATSGYSIVDTVTTLEFTVESPITDMDNMLWAREQRTFAVGFGPCGAGNGFGFIVPAGHATEDISKRVFEDDAIHQSFMLRAGVYVGDATDPYGDTDIRNSPVRIGLTG